MLFHWFQGGQQQQRREKSNGVISLVLCVKVRFDRNTVALTAVLKGAMFPNLMKTTVSETPKAQNVTGPQRKAMKTYPGEGPQKWMSIWHYDFQCFCNSSDKTLRGTDWTPPSGRGSKEASKGNSLDIWQFFNPR